MPVEYCCNQFKNWLLRTYYLEITEDSGDYYAQIVKIA